MYISERIIVLSNNPTDTESYNELTIILNRPSCDVKYFLILPCRDCSSSVWPPGWHFSRTRDQMLTGRPPAYSGERRSVGYRPVWTGSRRRGGNGSLTWTSSPLSSHRTSPLFIWRRQIRHFCSLYFLTSHYLRIPECQWRWSLDRLCYRGNVPGPHRSVSSRPLLQTSPELSMVLNTLEVKTNPDLETAGSEVSSLVPVRSPHENVGQTGFADTSTAEHDNPNNCCKNISLFMML